MNQIFRMSFFSTEWMIFLGRYVDTAFYLRHSSFDVIVSIGRYRQNSFEGIFVFEKSRNKKIIFPFIKNGKPLRKYDASISKTPSRVFLFLQFHGKSKIIKLNFFFQICFFYILYQCRKRFFCDHITKISKNIFVFLRNFENNLNAIINIEIGFFSRLLHVSHDISGVSFIFEFWGDTSIQSNANSVSRLQYLSNWSILRGDKLYFIFSFQKNEFSNFHMFLSFFFYDFKVS